MSEISTPPAPRRRKAARPPQPRTPQEEAAFTRRVRKAAREAEARQTSGAEAESETAASLPTPVADGPPQFDAPIDAPLDAHGHDPADYQWLPVRRKPRKDGWTPQRQQDFIAMLAETGCVRTAADHVDMSERSCYRLRRSPGGEQFAAAWDVALHHAARLLLDVAFERAFNGTDEPVFDKTGQRVGRRMRQNDRLMMFLLRAYMPERFRHAHRDARMADEALPPPPPALEHMIERLAPEMPAEPHAQMSPDALSDALLVADTLPPGELPRWHRGRGSNYAEPSPYTPEQEAEINRLIHGTGNDPKYDHIFGPRVR